jgi:hypothetical protein
MDEIIKERVLYKFCHESLWRCTQSTVVAYSCKCRGFCARLELAETLRPSIGLSLIFFVMRK